MPVLTLPLVSTSGPHGPRSRATCTFRCGNACARPEPNTSANTHIQEVLTTAVARRSVLRAGAAGSAVALIASPSLAAAATGSPRSRLAFKPVPPNRRDNVTVPPGYDYDVVIAWGDEVVPGAPRFDVYDQSPAAQAGQFGYNCDYVAVLPVPGARRRAVLVVNHEYTNEELMFPTGRYSDRQTKRIAMAAHGMSVVEIRRGRRDGSWQRVDVDRTSLNRRVTTETPIQVTGPAAGTRRLQTSADPGGRTVLGTLNNCAGGMTPWGTVLSGEENVNQYFDAGAGLSPRYAKSYARYGITGEDSRGWSSVDSRFNLSVEPHEPFRFGWVVELDPFHPDAPPRKRTMLGRMKHEGANVVVTGSGRVAAYMGDDERGDYLYKFVSAKKMRTGRGAAAHAHNLTLLDSGTLFVARFRGDGEADGEYDGTGRWLPLTSDTESFVDGMSVTDVLIDTRLAADAVRPTRMDRPEDVEVNPVNGKVYCALTNNDERGTTFRVNEANPLAESQVRAEIDAPLTTATGNRNGYVLELTPDDGDHTAASFSWSLMLVCGDPEAPETYFAGFPKDRVSPISCPDNVAFDQAGNLWVATDGNALGSNDGMFAVPVRGPHRGHVRQFLTVPVGAETCGPLISPDGDTVFNAVQHPGETDEATFENPSSSWPHTDRFPRPGVIATYRIDGRRVGL